MKTEADINLNILPWAVSRAGYDIAEFAIKFPRLSDWLEQTKKPTIKQLEEFARKVYLPFGYLFLKEPPIEDLPIPYFRTGVNEVEKVSLNVFDTILLIQRRQEWLSSYLKDNEFDKLDFVGKFRSETDHFKIVDNIRSTLKLSLNWASYFNTWEESLKYFVQKIEEQGIIVTFNGVVENNTKRPIPLDECRGFVLVDEMAPFMFVNATDTKAAHMFTISHELAHIWTGHSAGFDFRQLQPSQNSNEILCDKVAAELLVPQVLFEKKWLENKEIRHLSRFFKVSPIVIARRALDLSKITKQDFFSFYANYMAEFKGKKDQQSGGGDFYATSKKRLSVTFLSHVDNALKENKLLHRDAYKLTRLKGDTFQNLLTKHD